MAAAPATSAVAASSSKSKKGGSGKAKAKASSSSGGTSSADKLLALTFKLFSAHYAVAYDAPPGRWLSTLLPALERPTTHVALLNRYFCDSALCAAVTAAASKIAGDETAAVAETTTATPTDAKSAPSSGSLMETMLTAAPRATELERQLLDRWSAAGVVVRPQPVPGLYNRCYLLASASDAKATAAAAATPASAFPAPTSYGAAFEHSTLLPYYLLDPSSVVCAEALQIQPK